MYLASFLTKQQQHHQQQKQLVIRWRLSATCFIIPSTLLSPVLRLTERSLDGCSNNVNASPAKRDNG